jgi:hypothetical protein
MIGAHNLIAPRLYPHYSRPSARVASCLCDSIYMTLALQQHDKPRRDEDLPVPSFSKLDHPTRKLALGGVASADVPFYRIQLIPAEFLYMACNVMGLGPPTRTRVEFKDTPYWVIYTAKVPTTRNSRVRRLMDTYNLL